MKKKRSLAKTREEARRLYLTGECETNAEIAARLGTKPHTIGKWRRAEDWDSLRTKIDLRAAEMFIEKIATERVTLNVRHYRLWELLLAKLGQDLKKEAPLEIRDVERIAGVVDRAQKGQRLAKGLSVSGETEELVLAQSQAAIRQVIDAVIDSVKENVQDEETRDRIRQQILAAVPAETGDGAGEPGHAVGQ